ncbi:MAG: hypothetical protein GY749_21335 [Desulfobacteraceae bacterium]|nr:hypothetical protein [Desulfobacteraceae bacterium]
MKQSIIMICVIAMLSVGFSVGAFADPLSEIKILANDGDEQDLFGTSVSIDGDYVIVGATGNDDNGSDSGSAYIYHYEGNGWTQKAKLVADDGESGDRFGESVSIDGDYAIMAARFDDNSTGSAYIFHLGEDNGWNQQAKLVADDGDPGDWFGTSVSIDGNYAIIGAWGDNNKTGSAYIFYYNGNTWIQQAKLLVSDGATGDSFGSSVSIHGNYAIVGVCGDDAKGYRSGSAYIFERNDTTWTKQAKLVASDGASSDVFGNSVSVNGDYVIVGATGNDDRGDDSGSAYIFYYNGSAWIQQAKLLASDGDTWDSFGCTVSIDGDNAIVGAVANDDDGSLSGSAYIYHYDGKNWIQQPKLVASDGDEHDFFGTVSIDGDNAIVGATGNDNDGKSSGSAYIYKLDVVPGNTLPVIDQGMPDNIYVVGGETLEIKMSEKYPNAFKDADGDDIYYWFSNLHIWMDIEFSDECRTDPYPCDPTLVITPTSEDIGKVQTITVQAWDQYHAFPGNTNLTFNVNVITPETHTSTNNINSIWESPQGDVFFVGNYGTIMRSVGNSEPEPMDSGTTRVHFKSVCGTSDTDVYAVGSGNFGAATIYHYDGNSWEILTIPTNISTYADLRKIWVNGSDDFYLKASGYIYHCKNGIAARILDNDLYEGYGFSDVWIRSSSDIYVVGSKGGHGIMLHFDGTAWEEINMTHDGDPLNPISEVSGDSNGLYLKTYNPTYKAKNKIYFYNENNGQTGYIYKTERSIMHRGFATYSYAGYLSLRGRGPGMSMSLKPSYTSALGITAIHTGQQNVFLGTSANEIIILKGMGRPF